MNDAAAQLHSAVRFMLEDPRIKRAVVDAYIALCAVPPGLWRVQYEHVLAGLRDHIAEVLQADAEAVQTAAEEAANARSQ